MSSTDTLETMLRERVVCIVRLGDLSATRAVEVVEALLRGGLSVVEFTLNSADALEAVAAVTEALGDRCRVGAGTVLDAASASAAIEAGADFVVSPNVDTAVIAATRQGGAVSIPGACTATEVADARRAGADLVKLFPAGPLGPDYLRALLGPYDDARLVPTGGIELEDIPVFLRAGAVAVGVGSPLVGRGDPDEVEQRASRAIELMHAADAD